MAAEAVQHDVTGTPAARIGYRSNKWGRSAGFSHNEMTTDMCGRVLRFQPTGLMSVM